MEGFKRPSFFCNKNTNLGYTNMIVLTTATTPQTIYFIPRNGTGNSNTLVVTDEQTNVSTTISITTYTTGDYYHTATATFALVEGHTYTLKIKKDSEVRFYSKIYCTDNPSSTFTQSESTNEFLIYE